VALKKLEQSKRKSRFGSSKSKKDQKDRAQRKERKDQSEAMAKLETEKSDPAASQRGQERVRVCEREVNAVQRRIDENDAVDQSC